MKTLLGGFVVLVTLCWAQARGANPTPRRTASGAARGRALSERPLVDRADVARHGAGNTTRPTGKGIQWHGQGSPDAQVGGHSRGGVCRRALARRDVGRSHQGARRPLRQASQGASGGFLDILRDLAKDLGEWAIYAAIAMLAITLWKRFPFNVWRTLHRLMPIIYLTLAFHALALRPAGVLAGTCRDLVGGTPCRRHFRQHSCPRGQGRSLQTTCRAYRKPRYPLARSHRGRLQAGFRLACTQARSIRLRDLLAGRRRTSLHDCQRATIGSHDHVRDQGARRLHHGSGRETPRGTADRGRRAIWVLRHSSP